MTMPKTTLSSRIKIAFLNIMQAFGAAASHMASNAKLRVQEINLEARRHEILTEFSLQAFEMWHNGVKLPKELADMFVELSEIDDKLSIVRAQKYAKVKVECEVVSDDGGESIPTECSIEMPAGEAPTGKPAAGANSASAAKPDSEKAAAPQGDRKAHTAPKKKASAKPKE
jgi:hypothetical protein